MKNKISIIVPIYNEAKNISKLIVRIKEAMVEEKNPYEIIFVDDNSTDKTKSVFAKLRRKNIRLFKKIGKKGKAFSILEGFKKSTGDVVVMIDGDLQYPPEEIPQMIKALETSDIVIANRKEYKDSLLRRVLSKTFRSVFGQLLFGLDYDIQSGLKVVKREVIETIKFTPRSAWTLDLEFLHRAKEAGFSIQNFDITFSKRVNGESKINFVKQTFEIGTNALRLRAKKIQPAYVYPTKVNSMLGAGIRYKKRKYVTHTTMDYNLSALKTFTPLQKFVIFITLMEIVLGIYFSPLLTLQVIIAALSFIYFIDVIFNFYLIAKSLSFPQEIVSSEKEINSLKDKDLPIYTILCPLYKEAPIIPQFLEAIEKISWPKEKLEVILLLEEDDILTIQAAQRMDLPSYVRILVVPHSIPKTKPKACNYGLAHAKGKYLVVYDAEDIPDPLQLKKAFLGFKKVNKDVICLQAKLNYYNPHQNLLTRFFTAEYSLWFDVTLTGLQAVETTIPLGGTSNHFITASLLEVEGWDPFNVTEDADLGMRLFKKGYKTEIIDSITLEEANSKWGNWLRQRSRWIKGYMQTYLVHVRDLLTFTKERKRHSLIFQLVIGGKIAFVLINPILWLATIAYFALYAYVGPQIEALYPTGVLYMAVTSLVFGNFLFLYYYMIGVAKKGQWNLMKFVFLIPFYWLMISVAAFIALYQLILKPHYWEKTVHGLHLSKSEGAFVPEASAPFRKQRQFVFPNFRPRFSFALSNKHFEGGVFILATGVGSVFNLLYNAYLGRALSLEDFALISFVGGLFSFVSIVASSLGMTVTYKTGYLIGKHGDSSGFDYWKFIRTKAIIASVFITAFWIALSHLFLGFFKIDSIYPFILFSPILLVILASSTDKAFLSSRLSFGILGLLAIIEPVLKFSLAFVLVMLGLKTWAYTAIPFSVVISFLLGWVFILTRKRKLENLPNKDSNSFPNKFFFASLISGLSSVIFLNLDIVLAKHYLSPKEAGVYALAALIAKIVYFLGGFVSPFIIPLVSRNEGANKDSKAVLNKTIMGTFIFALFGVVAIAFLGEYTVPLAFGKKAIQTIPYLIPLSTAMLCFTIARVYGDYYLAKKYYSFSVIAVIIGVLQLGLIIFFHANILSFVYVMSSVWLLYLVTTLILHLYSNKVKVFENNVVDFLGLFAQIQPSSQKSDKLRILILNWRDTKHKWAGGAEVYIQELAKRWAKDGNSVTIFAGNDGEQKRNENINFPIEKAEKETIIFSANSLQNETKQVINGATIFSSSYEDEQAKEDQGNLEIIRRGGFYTVYIWGFLYYVLRFRGKYDVIIDSENGIPFFTPLYTRANKFLLIHHVHQEVFRKSLKWPLAQIALFLEATLMPIVYRNVQIITVSPSSKQEILKHRLTKKEPIIIYNGVDLNIFKPSKKSDKPLVLYLGRLQYYKSLHIFLVAAKRILKKIPNAEFVIAGEGGEKEKLIEFAEKIGILDKVKFLGRVSSKRKIELFQKAWIFVNPSFMEGWGITTIEANASGTPTVASRVPGLSDSIKHMETGILVRYGDYLGFTESIVRLIADAKLREKMSKESINWANEFSWEQSADKFYSVLLESVRSEEKIKASRLSYILNRLSSLL